MLDESPISVECSTSRMTTWCIASYRIDTNARGLPHITMYQLSRSLWVLPEEHGGSPLGREAFTDTIPNSRSLLRRP